MGGGVSKTVLRQELAALRAGTDRPFNVNFFCHAPPAPDAAAGVSAWSIRVRARCSLSSSGPMNKIELELDSNLKHGVSESPGIQVSESEPNLKT